MIIAHKSFYSIFGNVKANVNKWYWVYLAYKIEFSSPIEKKKKLLLSLNTRKV